VQRLFRLLVEDARSLCDPGSARPTHSGLPGRGRGGSRLAPVLGFSSGLLKRAADKLIPILLPYIDASTGECRHFPRYPKLPRLAVLYQDEPDTVDEDRAITREIWSRMARNANTSLIACLSTTMATTEVAHAIARA